MQATGDIGTFKITEVTALSAGHRRIFAVTGPQAIALFQECFDSIKTLSQEFKVKREEVVSAVLAQKEDYRQAQNQIKHLKKVSWKAQLPIWEQHIQKIGSIPFLFLSLDDATNEELKEITSHLMTKKAGFYFLTATSQGKHIYLCTIAKELADTIDMNKFALWLKDVHGLRGGGSKLLLQGGGSKFDVNLEASLKEWLKTQ